MPRAKSKAQQRMLFMLADRGVIPKKEAHDRAVKGRAFKARPEHKR